MTSDGNVGTYSISQDAGGTTWSGCCYVSDTTKLEMFAAAGGGITITNVYPFAWGGGNDAIRISGNINL
jgi:hypothetical protein